MEKRYYIFTKTGRYVGRGSYRSYSYLFTLKKNRGHYVLKYIH